MKRLSVNHWLVIVAGVLLALMAAEHIRATLTDRSALPVEQTKSPYAPTFNEAQRAPDFTLRRTFEESVSLAELLARGPVLLHFYVFDFGNF